MTENTPPEGDRLQKVLAAMGLGSRREIERWIEDGRITVNGRPAKLGDRVKQGDRVRVDRKEIRIGNRAAPKRRIIAYNKPEGEMVTRNDPEGRKTVFDHLPALRHSRWVAVGRLDINTSGLLLLTTDGELANRLMHPSHEIEREYSVRILGELRQSALQELTEGVALEDGPASFESVTAAGGSGANRWYRVVLKEGRNREVRRMWEAVGATVSRLIRLRYGNVEMGPRLFAGHWRNLEDKEIEALLELAGLEDDSQSEPRRMSSGKRPGSRSQQQRSAPARKGKPRRSKR